MMISHASSIRPLKTNYSGMKMNPESRKKIILNSLNERGVVSTQVVMKSCEVSEITIRRDLAELEKRGLLIRTHGGAVNSKAGDQLFTYDFKVNQNKQNKETICQLAAKFIKNNDIVFIDCGTTLSFLTKYIAKFESLIVITNSLPIVSELINFSNIKLILIGGEVADERKAIYGPIAENNISQYHASKAFIGADGVSLPNGLSSYDEKEAAITLKMAENADEVFLLCDSSKIEKNSFVKFAPFSKINYLITDKGLDPEHMKKYKESNINIITESL
jgi:DeoR family transcriptional regulator, fructose operon transcriptional repressor